MLLSTIPGQEDGAIRGSIDAYSFVGIESAFHKPNIWIMRGLEALMKLRMLACLFALAAAVALAAQERVLVAAAANIKRVKEPLGAASRNSIR